MKEQGKVVKVAEKTATVRIDKKDECSKCGMCLFPKNASHIDFEVENSVNALEGDEVVIETKKEGKLLGSLLVFLVPLLLIGVGLAIGLAVLKNELWALGISLGLVVVWYCVLALIDKKLKNSIGFKPIIIEKINLEKK